MTAVPRPRPSNSGDPVQEQIEYLGDAVVRLEEKTLSSEILAAAVATGMRQAVSSPEFWTDAMGAMGKHTKEAAGGILLNGLRGVISKIFLFVAAGLLVYSIGGWSGLASAFKAVMGLEVVKP